jgi:type VI secretion system secreted protein VgrG
MTPNYTTEDRLLYLTTPLGPDVLLLSGFNGKEAISELFQFELEILADNRVSVPFDQLLGQRIGFGINVLPNDACVQRDFDGICIRLTQGGRDQNLTRYSMTVAPKFWLLTQSFQSRIFQQKSVPDILKIVLTGLDVDYLIQGTFEPRDYCVQYQESDFHFASRLMEEEGIFYFFNFTSGNHKLVLANTPSSHPEIDDSSTLIYEELSGGLRAEERIASWEKAQDLRSGKYTLWDHCFELPHKHLEAQSTVIDSVPMGTVTHKLKVAGNDGLEIFEHPGLFAQRFDGVDKAGSPQPPEIQKIFTDNQRTVGIRMQQSEQPMLLVKGVGNCRQMSAGHKFTLTRHFNADGLYVLVSVTHSAEEGDFRTSSNSAASHYGNHFTCIPFGLAYAPSRKTPRPFIRGCQTAVVVGPSGEEIFTDKYGRVKVQFHWDRMGQYDGDSSCWIRVGTSWAGKQWGAISIPRIGHEVIVDFLEGDPDQPIITGSVYNADMMPSYTLPDNKTRSGVKSRSSIGGGGFNEIRFEDKKGSEQVFVYGQKDADIRFLNDRREWIGRDRHLIVTRDKYEQVQSDTHITIGRDHLESIGRDRNVAVSGKEAISIGSSQSLNVTGNLNEQIGGNHGEQTTGSYYLQAQTIVLEAQTGLTLSVGGNFITLSPAGIMITGSPLVLINSGGAAIPGVPGMLVSPASPTAPAVADDATFGGAQTYTQDGSPPSPAAGTSGPSSSSSASTAPRHDPNDPGNQDKKHYIAIQLFDEQNLPVAGEPYEIVLPDGSTIASGTTDDKGQARVDNIDAGQCRVRFPKRDQTVVKPK